MNNPFDYIPNEACEEAFRELETRLESLKRSENPSDLEFCRELESGKMLGVLIATDRGGVRHTLYAFSGQTGKGGFQRHGFVGPVFDYLQPEGYFKKREEEIVRQNEEIERVEKEIIEGLREDCARERKRLEEEVMAYKERCRMSKLARERRRMEGDLTEEEREGMIRQSQYEKAELHRRKKRMKAALEPIERKLKDGEQRLMTLKEKRRQRSEELQQWLFDNFQVLNGRGESRSMTEIFARTSLRIPPSGAGECCGPKLLQEAYRRGWHPDWIAEYWYGQSKSGELRTHGTSYPACRGKCLPVMSWMLEGVEVEPPLSEEYHSMLKEEPEIVYECRWFCVVNKPAGMLSVRGKGAALSVEEWLEKKYGEERRVKPVHRLDQATSGLLLAAFGDSVFKELQSLFATRRIKKTYVAELAGDYEKEGLAKTGRISLPLSADWIDRPRQRVDFEKGKEGLTDYEFTGRRGGKSRVKFYPLTGRTHQLRIHAASEYGLGLPIVGDRLYGKKGGHESERLHLHAYRLEFTLPSSGEVYSFESPIPF